MLIYGKCQLFVNHPTACYWSTLAHRQRLRFVNRLLCVNRQPFANAHFTRFARSAHVARNPAGIEPNHQVPRAPHHQLHPEEEEPPSSPKSCSRFSRICCVARVAVQGLAGEEVAVAAAVDRHRRREVFRRGGPRTAGPLPRAEREGRSRDTDTDRKGCRRRRRLIIPL